MSEYYIKQPDTDHARGPLTLEQLASLAETGSVSQETLLYDEAKEKWKPISSYRELVPQIFPETKRLQLKRDTERRGFGLFRPAKEVDPDPDTGVSAEKILLAAEGLTKDTKHLYEAKESMERAAEFALPGLGLLLIISGIGLFYPDMANIGSLMQEQPFWAIFTRPFLLIGALDIACGILCFLSVSETYPFLRVRAGFGMGLFGFTFWAWQSPLLAASVAITSLCIFLVTITKRESVMKGTLVFGIVSALLVAYFSISGTLVVSL